VGGGARQVRVGAAGAHPAALVAAAAAGAPPAAAQRARQPHRASRKRQMEPEACAVVYSSGCATPAALLICRAVPRCRPRLLPRPGCFIEPCRRKRARSGVPRRTRECGWRGRQEQRWLHGVDVTGSRFLGRPEVLRAARFAAEAHAGQARRPLGPWPARAARVPRPRSALARRLLRPCLSARRTAAEQTQLRGADCHAAAKRRAVGRSLAGGLLVAWRGVPYPDPMAWRAGAADGRPVRRAPGGDRLHRGVPAVRHAGRGRRAVRACPGPRRA
jgi:hypothetical protein